MELACVMFPMPNAAAAANSENKKASALPSFFRRKPFFIAYIGPPAISPFGCFSRYRTASTLSANLVERPNSALIHIHTSAPGPPSTIAVATPTRLPVPMVAASAVISD